MTTVFISGSMNIKHLDHKVKERIDKIIALNLDVIVGDADGVDSSIQTYLYQHGSNKTKVYCSGLQPRNNVGSWPTVCVKSKYTPGTRAYFTEKDVKMAEDADYGLMVWDAKSTGTLSNVIELLSKRKKSVVFINKDKEFQTISDVLHLETLVMSMSEHAINKADEKLNLHQKIDALKHEQLQMFV